MMEEMESMWNAMKSTHYKRTINQLTRSIEDTKDLDAALHVALEMVLSAVHAQTGSFWFYDRFKDGCIHVKATSEGADLSNIRLLPGEGIAGQVIQNGTSVIIQDCQADPRWAGRVDKKTGFCTKTMICVPLSLDTLVFGCIQIINKTDGMAFDEKDLAFAERLAAEIASVLKHQGLLEDYYAAAKSREVPSDAVSFQEVFCASSERELEYALRNIRQFSGLVRRDQQEVLRLAQQIRKLMLKAK